MKKLVLLVMAASALTLSGCERDTQIASKNVSKAADNFEVNRRVVFYNGITGEYMLSIEGYCALESNTNKVQVTCKVGENKVKRHQLGLSDNVTYMAEHLEPTGVSFYHHRVIFKPQSIIPEIDLRTDVDELIEDRH